MMANILWTELWHVYVFFMQLMYLSLRCCHRAFSRSFSRLFSVSIRVELQLELSILSLFSINLIVVLLWCYARLRISLLNFSVIHCLRLYFIFWIINTDLLSIPRALLLLLDISGRHGTLLYICGALNNFPSRINSFHLRFLAQKCWILNCHCFSSTWLFLIAHHAHLDISLICTTNSHCK